MAAKPPKKARVAKAVVHVEPHVEAGLDRGGEDLYLDFIAEVKGRKIPTECDIVLNVDDDADGYNVERLDKEAEDEWARHEDQPYKGKVRYWTWHYEHQWVGDQEDARKLVYAHFRMKVNWSFCHKPGEKPRLRFKYRHYVTGNAE